MIETYQFETNTINMISSKMPFSFKIDGEFITLVCTYLVQDFLRYGRNPSPNLILWNYNLHMEDFEML